VSETDCKVETVLGLAVTEALRTPRIMVLVLLKETDVAPNAFIVRTRKRRGDAKMLSRPKFPLYVTDTMKAGPVPMDSKLPAHTLMVIGVVAATCAASDVGTPTGVSQTKLLLVDGHTPVVIPPPETVTAGMSEAVPWLSMQKYAEVEEVPAVSAQVNGVKPAFL
jgi:hypothetical protein